MPYRSNEDLPRSVRDHLPLEAQEMFRKVFNNAWREYSDRGLDEVEALAFRVAWAAVKRHYRKIGSDWVPI
jgi:cation transport regulator